MNTKPQTVPQDLWDQVASEKKKDMRVRRISMVAWSVTGLAILFYGSIVFQRFLYFQNMVDTGVMPSGSEWTALIPLAGVVGLVALFVAILATVGMFFRLRTSSVEELKVRLSALEELVLDHVDTARS